MSDDKTMHVVASYPDPLELYRFKMKGALQSELTINERLLSISDLWESRAKRDFYRIILRTESKCASSGFNSERKVSILLSVPKYQQGL